MSQMDTPEHVAQALREATLEIRTRVGRSFVGNEALVDLVWAAILARGHVLLEGGPGLGKTLLIKLFGRLLGLNVGRVQFTPDLMPADILGGQVLETTASGPVVQFNAGPIFTQLLLADEINRANPRTQAALLEAMAEGQVTIAGETRRLDQAFFVLATNNPIDMEGTYPLPEAQADRFLMKVGVNHPSREVILKILDVAPNEALATAAPCVSPDVLEAFRKHVASIPASDAVRGLIADLIVATQPGAERPEIVLGASPRAAQGLLAVARSRAAMAGRLHVTEADVLALALPVLRHRVIVSYSARAEGVSVDGLLAELVQRFGRTSTS